MGRNLHILILALTVVPTDRRPLQMILIPDHDGHLILVIHKRRARRRTWPMPMQHPAPRPRPLRDDDARQHVLQIARIARAQRTRERRRRVRRRRGRVGDAAATQRRLRGRAQPRHGAAAQQVQRLGAAPVAAAQAAGGGRDLLELLVVGVEMGMAVLRLRVEERAAGEGTRLGARAVAAAGAAVADAQREVVKPRGEDVLVVALVHGCWIRWTKPENVCDGLLYS